LIPAQVILAVLSGAAVGFSLGLIGGGGSILAVPLLLYAVGITDPHVAIGTSAVAVSVNAFANLVIHWRAGTVHWPCASIFGSAGALGAAAGSTLGKLVDGEKLIVLFALVMIAAGIAMLRPQASAGQRCARIDNRVALRLGMLGIAAGFIAGFFGIGGGFLVVPGIVLGSGIPILNAIGSSLFSVGVFSMTTALNYELSGFVVWTVAAEFIAGGVIGGFFGMKAAVKLAPKRDTLSYVFSGAVFAAAGYMLLRAGMSALG
jgi:uncharacterized membrane protein YfcA